MTPLTDKEIDHHEKQKNILYVLKGLVIIKNKNKNIIFTKKLETIAISQVNIEVQHILFVT